MTDRSPKQRKIDSACQLLERIYRDSIRAVRGDVVVRDFLLNNPVRSDFYVVAIGKAAAAMARGAEAVLGERVRAGLVITAPEYVDQPIAPMFKVRFGNHPVPGPDSLSAGAELLRFVSETSVDTHWLFLISGGASALVEAPVEGQALSSIVELNRTLLASGKDIVAINRERKRVSKIKGGGLLTYLRGTSVSALYISDVPSDRVETIGSGLLVSDSSPIPVAHHVIANLTMALAAASDAAGRYDFDAFVHSDRIEGEALPLARQLIKCLRDAPYGVHIWGGEPTVTLPANPGSGGRAQMLCAAALDQLTDADSNLTFFSAGSDGRDGPSPFSGACVNYALKERMERMNLKLESFLTTANVSELFRKLDCALPSFASGTNVTDILLALKTQK